MKLILSIIDKFRTPIQTIDTIESRLVDGPLDVSSKKACAQLPIIATYEKMTHEYEGLTPVSSRVDVAFLATYEQLPQQRVAPEVGYHVSSAQYQIILGSSKPIVRVMGYKKGICLRTQEIQDALCARDKPYFEKSCYPSASQEDEARLETAVAVLIPTQASHEYAQQAHAILESQGYKQTEALRRFTHI